MAEVRILKAVEFSKLSAKFKKQYKDEQALYDAGWWLQPKYDGCYAEFHVDRRGPATSRANTRTNEPILSCQHIMDQLINLTPYGSQCVYVGELWAIGQDVRFPEISGKVRRHYAAPDLCFVGFDLLPPGLVTTEAYKLRYERLVERFDWAPGTSILYASSDSKYTSFNDRPVKARAADLKASGKFDGCVLRDPTAGYTIGLVKNGEIVKVKPVLSLDLLVTGLHCALGEKTGRNVYTLSVVHNGVISEVGSGMPHVLPDDLKIGAIVEVEAMGLTDDGKLREPRFKGVRHDKEQADV